MYIVSHSNSASSVSVRVSKLTANKGKTIPTKKSPIQLRVEATVKAADWKEWVKSSPGRGTATQPVSHRDGER